MTHARRYLALLDRPPMPLGFLTPDAILPAQWRAPRRASPGVHRLYVALLAGAVLEVRTYQKLQRPLPVPLRAWFFGAPAKISFADACGVIGLSPDAVRRGLGLTPAVRSAA